MRRRAAILLVCLQLAAARAGAEEKPEFVFENGPQKGTIVFLFTSDATSTSNPALQWASQQTRHSGLWTRFVPVAMHVSHWDAPSFRDARSKKEFDAILDGYKKNWKAANLYAPTLVVDGQEWSGWSRGQDVPGDTRPTGTLKAVKMRFEDTYTVTFAPDPSAGRGPFTLHSALLAFGFVTKPTDGKNRGKTLTHDFMAMLYQNKDLYPSQGIFTAKVDLKVPRAAGSERFGIVFWVTKKSSQQPLQITGGPLWKER